MWSMRQEYMPRYKVQRKVKKRNLQSFFVKKRLYLPLLPFRGVFSTGFSSFSAFCSRRFDDLCLLSIRRSRSGHPFSGNQTMKAGGSACHETLPEMKEGALPLKCGRNVPRTRDSSHDAIDLQTMRKTMPRSDCTLHAFAPQNAFLKM